MNKFDWKCYLKTTNQRRSISAALLLVRLAMGIAFMYHGWGKIQIPMSWMPADSGVPGILQFLAALSEFGGGIALILGLITRVAMTGLAFTMAVAVFMHAVTMKHPFVSMTAGGPSYELAGIYFTLTILFLATGAGKYSLDAKIFGQKG